MLFYRFWYKTMGYIYKITNIISNKCYIGETIQDVLCGKTKTCRGFIWKFEQLV